MCYTLFMTFQRIEDFDAQSANGGKCYISNLPRQVFDPRSPHTAGQDFDEFILRGPMIDFEGYLDIRPSVIVAEARALGMLTVEEVAEIQERSEDAEAAVLAAESEFLRLRTLNEALLLAQADSIIEFQALELELGQAYDDLYDDSDDHLSVEALIVQELS